MAKASRSTNSKYSLTLVGVALIAFGLLLAVFGVFGLIISPHSCPGVVPGCIANPTPFQLIATYLGLSLIAAGTVSLVVAKYHGPQQQPTA